MTEHLTVDPLHPDSKLIARAADCLQHGGLVAFPTETVYGLGVHALDVDAIQRLFLAKKRPANDPVIIHVASLQTLEPLVLETPWITLTEHFWPGPLTLVLPRSQRVPDEITAGGATVAVRMPNHPVAQALLNKVGLPIAAPSANLFGHPSPTSAQHVLDDLNDCIDMVVDGGNTPVGLESTVLDLTSTPPMILRPGAISLDMLRTIIPDVTTRIATTHETMRSPGLLQQHYSPRASLVVYEGDPSRVRARLIKESRAATTKGRRVGVLVPREELKTFAEMEVAVAECGISGDSTSTAKRLYAALRELDAIGVDLILVFGVFKHGDHLEAALRDRLRRAAAGQVKNA